MAKNLAKTIEEHSLTRYEWGNLQTDVHLLAETAKENFWQRDYSISNPAGRFEISIDPQKLDHALEALDEQNAQLAEANESLDGIHSETRTISRNTGMMVESLDSIDESVQEGNLFLASIDSNTEDISDKLKFIGEINTANLVVNSIGVATAIYYGEVLLEQAEHMNDSLASIDGRLDSMDESLESIDYTLGEVVDNQWAMIENQEIMIDLLEEGFEQLAEGQKIIIGNQRIMIRNQKVIVEQLQNIGQEINQLGRIVYDGFQNLKTSVLDVYIQHHKESMAQQQRIAENFLDFRSHEKYNHAFKQYKAGNKTQAIKDVREALRQNSTHIPSLLLLSQLNVERLQWKAAKDILWHTSKLAVLNEDKIGYETALIRLANIEFFVGNVKKGEDILYKGLWGSGLGHSITLRKEYLQKYAQRISSRKKNSEEVKDLGSFLRAILREEPQFWEKLLSDKIYDLVLEKSKMRYGPLSLLRKNLTEILAGDFDEIVKTGYSLFDWTTAKVNGFAKNINLLSNSLDKIVNYKEGKKLRENKELIDRLSAFQNLLFSFNQIYNEYSLQFKDRSHKDYNSLTKLGEKIDAYSPVVHLLSVLADIYAVNNTTIQFYDFKKETRRETYNAEELSALANAFSSHSLYLQLKRSGAKDKDTITDQAIAVQTVVLSQAVSCYDKLKLHAMSGQLLLEAGDIERAIRRLKTAQLYEKAAIVAYENGLLGYENEAGELYTLAIQQSIAKNDLEHAIRLTEKAGWRGNDLHIELLLKAKRIEDAISLIVNKKGVKDSIIYLSQNGFFSYAARIAEENNLLQQVIPLYIQANLPLEALRFVREKRFEEAELSILVHINKFEEALNVAEKMAANYCVRYGESWHNQFSISGLYGYAIQYNKRPGQKRGELIRLDKKIRII